MKITKGLQKKPFRALVYGESKVGKSTFAASFPRPVFVCGEDGVDNLAVDSTTPASFSDLRATLKELMSHDYETIVIDSVDWIAPLIHAAVIGEAKPTKHGAKPTTIAEVGGGFGAGPAAAVDKWRLILSDLDQHRAAGRNVILIGHAQISSFQNPIGDDYSQYRLSLSKSEAAVLREWSDVIGFACIDTTVTTDGRKKSLEVGTREIHVDKTNAFEAGNRYGMRSPLPLDSQAFLSEIEKAHEDFGAKLDALCVSRPDLADRITAARRVIGSDNRKLKALYNKAIQTTQETAS